MRGRPTRQDGKSQVSIHKVKAYWYASTNKKTINPETGKSVYHRVHWGIVDKNLKFMPNLTYILSTKEERKTLIFPKEWNLEEIKKIDEINSKDIEEKNLCEENKVNDEYSDKLYGHIWLLEKIAESIGLFEDLLKVFNQDIIKVRIILTLAIFMYVCKEPFMYLESEQESTKFPYDKKLTSKNITNLMQSITEQNKIELFRLRKDRMSKNKTLCVDSTTRSSYGNVMSSLERGFNKNHDSLKQTVEVVAYSIDDHQPIYYKTYPGNMNDSRSLSDILDDLKYIGLKDYIIITDRGYESIYNLENYILNDSKIIMCAKVRHNYISQFIPNIPSEHLIIDYDYSKDFDVFHKQYNYTYQVKGDNGNIIASKDLKINIYFDQTRNAEETKVIYSYIQDEYKELEYYIKQNSNINIDYINKKCIYHTIKKSDKDSSIIIEKDINKISKECKYCGFFSIVTSNINLSSLEVLSHYRMRDEQEKYFTQMKSGLGGNRNRTCSELGKNGKEFLLFIGLILSSVLKYTFLSTDLKNRFKSSYEVITKMKSIHYVKRKGCKPHMTAFIGIQNDVCKAFNIAIPEGCAPRFPSLTKPKPRKGRSRKFNFSDNSQEDKAPDASGAIQS